MVTLRLIKEEDCQLLVDWNIGKDESYLFQWAGFRVYTYPITKSQIKNRIKNNALIYIILENENPVGSIELEKIDYKTHSANICRFIIKDDSKGKGIGTEAIRQISHLAFNEMKLVELTLGVFEYNLEAIRCYEKCGFLIEKHNIHENPKWNSYTMILKK